MNRNQTRLIFLLAIGLAVITGLRQTPVHAFDVFRDMPPQLIGWNSNTEIHIHSAAEADAVRQNLIDYLWNGRGLPTAAASTVSTGSLASYADVNLLNPAYVASVEKWQANMDYGYSTNMYLLRPVNTTNAQRLAIVHHGHAGYGGRFGNGIGTLTDHLLKNGFTVLEMGMPLYSWNSTTATFNLPTGTVNLTNHNQMVSTLEGKNGSSLRFFLEPIVQGINKFIQTTPNHADISMFGISGGGWTTTLTTAIEPRIQVSVPVAGSLPLTIRDAYAAAQGYGYNDDAEQELPAMYLNRATYEDLYVLGGYGAGRQQIQLNNQFDNCCFYGISGQTYAANVSSAVAATQAGSWSYYLDSTVNTHQISTNAVYNVIDPALGITPVRPTAITLNEQFSGASTPPAGWRYDPSNGAGTTISSSGGVVQFSSGGGVKSIVSNASFDPNAVPMTATIKINSIGSGGYLGMFFTEDPYARTHHFGLQVSSTGQLLMNTDHGNGFRQDTLTTLSGYTGGAITLKLTFDANGFIASTDVGNYNSGRRTYTSLTNGYQYNGKDLGMEAFAFLQYYAGTSTGRVDWFTLAPTDFTWNAAAGGNWSLDANWSSAWAAAGAGVTAKFTNSIDSGAIVNLNAATILGKLLFNNSQSYKIAGSSALTLSPGYLGTNQLEVDAGNHEIAVPILMSAATEADVATGSILLLSGNVSGSGNLTKKGGGNLTLTKNTAYTGDTSVNEGSLTFFGALDTPAAKVNVYGSSTMNAQTIVCDTLTIGGAPPAAVPEPGVLALLVLAGACGGLAFMRCRR